MNMKSPDKRASRHLLLDRRHLGSWIIFMSLEDADVLNECVGLYSFRHHLLSFGVVLVKETVQFGEGDGVIEARHAGLVGDGAGGVNEASPCGAGEG
jgi:hypothetical protein